MSTTTRPLATTTELRWRGRIPLALLLPVGPAMVALLRYLIPYDTTDSSTEIARQIAQHQTAENVAVWLGFVGMIALVPAVLAVGKVARRESPRLAAAGLTLLVPGYLVIGWLVASDAAALFAVRHGASTAFVGDIYAELHPSAIVAGAIFVLGHVVGTVLLGCALLRGSAIPRWASIAIIAAQPLHFVAAVVVSSHELDLFAWGLNAVGFAVVSRAMLRMSDEEWAAH